MENTTKVQVKDLLKLQTPFAIMQYYISLKARKNETQKVYELLYADLKHKVVRYKKLHDLEIELLKNNLHQIKIIIENKNGKIYEFNNFKLFTELNKIKHF